MTRSPRRPDEGVEDLVAAYRADLLAAGMLMGLSFGRTRRCVESVTVRRR